jgi:uncharacterized protein
MQLLRTRDYRRTRWKNDGGWTTEIAQQAMPGGVEGFSWRVSIANIEVDGPFSSFPGIDRDLVLLSGKGIELDINDAPTIRLDHRFQRIRFSGDDSVNCRLLAGPTQDFNVMTARGLVSAEVYPHPLKGTMLLFVSTATSWLIHVIGGSAAVRSSDSILSAETGDTLLIGTSASANERVVIEGSGELILVKFNHQDGASWRHPGLSRSSP